LRPWIRRAAACAFGFPALLALAADAREGQKRADPVRVYYDGGDCGTDEIEVQVYDRLHKRWHKHPQHYRVHVPSCQVEDAGQLWNELRWRCGPRPDVAHEPWRVVRVFDSEAMSHCAADQLGSAARDAAIAVEEPVENSSIRVPEPFVQVRGSVEVDGLEGNDYDLVLLVDRGAPQEAIDAQVSAARAFSRTLGKRLGRVRVAVLSFPGQGRAGAHSELAWSSDPTQIDAALAQISDRSVNAPDALPGALHSALDLLQQSGRPDARPTIVLAIDGRRLDSTAEPPPNDPLVRATARAGESGAMLYWVALGGLAPEHPALVRRALANARGTYRRVPPQEFDTPFFDPIALPIADKVWIEAPDASADDVSAGLSRDGHFSARVPVVGGSNSLVIHARTSDGAMHELPFAFTVYTGRPAAKPHTEPSKRIEMRPEEDAP
jgi:hypothetical protein